MGARALIGLVGLTLAAFVVACEGPHARALDAQVRPSARAGYYRVEAHLVNSGGRGQVELTIRLRNERNGQIVTEARSVDLEPHDRTDVAVEIAAPPADYAVDVRVGYPPM